MFLKKTGTLLFNFLFPGECDYCRRPLGEGDYIQVCRACTTRLAMPAAAGTPLCPVCSHPAPPGGECPSCPDGGFLFGRNRSLFLNSGFCQQFLYDYKFNRRPHYARIIRDLILEREGDYIREYDILVPVVLGRETLFERDFCQVEQVVKQVSRRSGVRMVRALRKKKLPGDRFQHFKTSEERRQDAFQSFTFVKRYAALLRGAKILVVDDILTSGATINASIRHIRENTLPDTVDSFTFARSVLEGR